MGIQDTLERAIYQNINEILANPENQKEIRDKFPDPKLTRRNMGYAIDSLLDSEIFTEGGESFQFLQIAGRLGGNANLFSSN